MNKVAYKFLRTGLKSFRDGSKWNIGEWRKVDPPSELCVGLNASKYIQDALLYVQGALLAKVEYKGVVVSSADKITCEYMRIVKVWKWSKIKSVKMAIYSAELVVGIYEKEFPEDDCPRKAIEAAKRWIVSPSKKNRDAAAYAAHAAHAAADAAYAAADAAYAARAAACAAACAAYAARAAACAAACAADKIKRKIHRYILALCEKEEK